MKILSTLYKTPLDIAKLARVFWLIILLATLILSLMYKEFILYIVLGIFLGLGLEQTWWWNLLFRKKKSKIIIKFLVADYVKSWIEERRKIKL